MPAGPYMLSTGRREPSGRMYSARRVMSTGSCSSATRESLPMAWAVPAGMKYTSPGRMGIWCRQSSRAAVSCRSISSRKYAGVTPGRNPSQMHAPGRVSSTYHASSFPEGRPKYFRARAPSGWVWSSRRSLEWSSLSRKPRLTPQCAA
ncbi:hypothetical protein [Flavonifractor plautii]|uniref:hypothetical protein n=1 Tax=Flavonifractor plautii TaxID=292800 RepID=UPI00210D9099|nr:hypothetical protein [Flavonifractor plautii]